MPGDTYLLHFSQLYMLSPLSSSAEKNAARQSWRVMVGPHSQLQGARQKGKGLFLYSTVSSPSKRFTRYLPDRPVHSDTNSTSLGNVLATQQLRAKNRHSR